jgi:hypothetical protein
MPQTETIFKSDLLDELLSSQTQAAHFLELALLALREEPVIASKVGLYSRLIENTYI